MVTDVLSTYKPVVDRLGLERQVCVMRYEDEKNVARRLRDMRGWREWKPRLRSLLDGLPDDGSKQ